MKKETILIAVVALIVGFLGGYLALTLSGNKRNALQNPAAEVTATGAAVDLTQRAAELEKIVAATPGNLDAWVTLGNAYFDSQQPQKAIQAYGKALEIKPDNPDVLTDQGIMFRKVGWYDRALANFEKAQKLNPNHLQSLYNLGVVQMADLKHPEKALPHWKRYLTLDSSSETAQRIKETLAGMGNNRNQTQTVETR